MEGSNIRKTTPDLQSILSTLAQFATPIQSNAPFSNQEQNEVQPHISAPASQRLQPRTSPYDPSARINEPHLRPQSRASANASPKPIDPASITTWQDGLRCVTKIAAQNAQFATTIRRMMADQRKHEMRWYSERQALKQKQASRSSSAAQAHSILQSLSSIAQAGPASAAESETSNEVELTALDSRIYAAQVEMDTAMTAELKGLGVPFFGTDRSLVMSEEEDQTLKPSSESQPKWSPAVTEKQLMELRRRMVGHLEDLYRE